MYKYGEQRAVQEKIQEYLEPFVGRDYFVQFMLNKSGVEPTKHKLRSVLLANCLKRSRIYIEFYSNHDLNKLVVIHPAFEYSWLEERLHETMRNPQRNQSIDEAIRGLIEFLKVIHT